MFTTARRQDGTDSLQSWYGAPRHEKRGGDDIEFERYGTPNHDERIEPIGFIPEIEYRSRMVERTRIRRSHSPLMNS